MGKELSKHLNYQRPSDITKMLYDTKGTLKNNKLVNLFKRELRWLRDGTSLRMKLKLKSQIK